MEPQTYTQIHSQTLLQWLMPLYLSTEMLLPFGEALTDHQYILVTSCGFWKRAQDIQSNPLHESQCLTYYHQGSSLVTWRFSRGTNNTIPASFL